MKADVKKNVRIGAAILMVAVTLALAFFNMHAFSESDANTVVVIVIDAIYVAILVLAYRYFRRALRGLDEIKVQMAQPEPAADSDPDPQPEEKTGIMVSAEDAAYLANQKLWDERSKGLHVVLARTTTSPLVGLLLPGLLEVLDVLNDFRTYESEMQAAEVSAVHSVLDEIVKEGGKKRTNAATAIRISTWASLASDAMKALILPHLQKTVARHSAKNR